MLSVLSLVSGLTTIVRPYRVSRALGLFVHAGYAQPAALLVR